MDIRRVVGKNVRRYRKEAELSKEELAARIGVEQGCVSRLEAGKRNPTIVTIWGGGGGIGRLSSRVVSGACSVFKSDCNAKKDPKADHPI